MNSPGSDLPPLGLILEASRDLSRQMLREKALPVADLFDLAAAGNPVALARLVDDLEGHE